MSLEFYNWWAKYIGRVKIPRQLYFTHKLHICDFCGENRLGKVAQIIDYMWEEPVWSDKGYRLGFVYAHKNPSDCRANKALLRETKK